MADIQMSTESLEALKARLATPEGQEALRKLARLIAETAVDAIPSDLRQSLVTEEGMGAFRAAWPDIVSAFLFRGVGKHPGRKSGDVRKSPPPTRRAR